MKNILGVIFSVVLMLAGAGVACAGSSLDSAAYHIKAAGSYVDQGRDADALREYNAAVKRDAENFDAWLGKAHVLIRLHDNEGAAQAIATLEDIEDSKAQKFEWLQADLQYNVVFKPEHWLSRAKDDYFKAKNINAERSGLHLWVARAYRDGGKVRKAQMHYRKAIELGGDDASRATAEMSAMQRKTVAAGTGKGVAGELAGKASIDRATLAAVLIDQLHVQNLFGERTHTVAIPGDSKDSPYAAAIESLLNLNITSLERDAHGRFHPNQPVTRIELARLIQEYLVAVSHDKNLNHAFVGTKSPFPDLSSNHYAFNAAFLAVSRGLMQPADILTGKFEGGKPVSGVDLLLVLRKLGSLSPKG